MVTVASAMMGFANPLPVSASAVSPFQFGFHPPPTPTMRSRGIGILRCSRSNSDDDDIRGGGGGADDGDNTSTWISSPSTASPYHILGLDPTSSISPARLKAAFRSRVKEFHPDVCQDTLVDADAIIQHVIRAYEILSRRHHDEDAEGACLDPFDQPECEAFDIFVNETLCIGKGCSHSCVQRAPQTFSFTAEYGTARATSQGHGDDYKVQLAVAQCPRRCIHYVTPLQRSLLADLLQSVLDDPYNAGDAALLESLILKAAFENNRYEEPKRQSKASTEFVDWC